MACGHSLKREIAQGRGLNRPRHDGTLAHIGGQLAQEAILAASPNNPDHLKPSARYGLQGIEHLPIPECDAVQAAPHDFTYGRWFGLSGIPTVAPDSRRRESQGEVLAEADGVLARVFRRADARAAGVGALQAAHGLEEVEPGRCVLQALF